jgi:hypothetical protein
MKRENLELRASYARLLGWVAIGLGVLSTWPWLASSLFSLILGLIVAAAFGYILAMLAGLGRMH